METLPAAADKHMVRMDIAKVISRLSKDPSTKIGCALVSPDGKKIIPAYNGFPSLVPDNKTWWGNRDENEGEFCKYDLAVHAELNALDNANCDVSGWSLYITCRPCLPCALQIVSRKIANVYYLNKKINMDIKADKVNRLFKLADINFTNLGSDEVTNDFEAHGNGD
jgi:dCMP deaminase